MNELIKGHHSLDLSWGQVILSFERPFWDEGADFFGCLPPAAETAAEAAKARGEFFMFWNLQRSHGTAALMCVSSGAFAEGTWRHLSYKRVVGSSLAVLNSYLIHELIN